MPANLDAASVDKTANSHELIHGDVSGQCVFSDRMALQTLQDVLEALHSMASTRAMHLEEVVRTVRPGGCSCLRQPHVDLSLADFACVVIFVVLVL